MALPFGSTYITIQNSHSASSRQALFIHILFSKVHPNGIRCFYRRYRGVRCTAWLPTPTGWNYFRWFWCHFSSLFFFWRLPRLLFYVLTAPHHKSNIMWICCAEMNRTERHTQKNCRDDILLLTSVAGIVVCHSKAEFSFHAGILIQKIEA